MKLLLFDIDGTLISAGGAGTRSLNRAFEKVLGIREAFVNFEMAGKTDIQIIKEGLKLYGIIPEKNLIDDLIDSYLMFLQVEINNNSKHIKPGVVDFINFMTGTFSYPMGLLTGNLEKGARIKLEPFALNSYFPFGAFGSDHENRNNLLPIAVERYEKFFKKTIKFSDCIVIGDTPRDVACAKPYGAKVIAVATGPFTKGELQNTEADVVVESLSEIDRIQQILF